MHSRGSVKEQIVSLSAKTEVNSRANTSGQTLLAASCYGSGL